MSVNEAVLAEAFLKQDQGPKENLVQAHADLSPVKIAFKALDALLDLASAACGRRCLSV